MSRDSIPPALRAQLSQAMAEGAEWSDLLVAKWREQVQAQGEAEAAVALYTSMLLTDRDKLITAVMCLVSRLNRVEVSP